MAKLVWCRHDRALTYAETTGWTSLMRSGDENVSKVVYTWACQVYHTNITPLRNFLFVSFARMKGKAKVELTLRCLPFIIFFSSALYWYTLKGSILPLFYPSFERNFKNHAQALGQQPLCNVVFFFRATPKKKECKLIRL